MLRAVIFDFDGLILDTELPEYQAWCTIYESHGHSLALETWNQAVGTRDGFDPYADLQLLTGLTLERAGIRARRQGLQEELMRDIVPLPGVVERLDEAAFLGWEVGLASSSDRAWVAGHLERHALLHRFDCICCAVDSGLPAKPDPATYLAVLRDLGLAADDAVAFEDSAHGVAAARAAGIRCVAVPNSVTRVSDFSQADLVVPSLETVTLATLEAALRGGSTPQ